MDWDEVLSAVDEQIAAPVTLAEAVEALDDLIGELRKRQSAMREDMARGDGEATVRQGGEG